MSRKRGARRGLRVSFPRVSGDEPLAQFKDDTFHKFSPRERG